MRYLIFWLAFVAPFWGEAQKKTNPIISKMHANALNKLAVGDTLGSLAGCENLLKQFPESAYGYNCLGTHYLELGHFKKSIYYFDRAQKIDSNEINYFERGNAKAFNHDYTGALCDYKKITSDPDTFSKSNLLAFYNTGEIHFLNGNYKQAITYYNIILKRRPLFFYSYAYLSRGIAKYKLADYKGAIRDFSNTLENYQDLQLASFYLGLSFTALKDYKKAITYFTKITKQKIPFRDAYYQLASCYDSLEIYPLAVENYSLYITTESTRIAQKNKHKQKWHCCLYSQKLSISDDTLTNKSLLPEAYVARGRLKAKANNHKDALLDFEQAVKVKSDYADAFYQRAGSYFALNNKKSACADLKKAQQLGYKMAVDAMEKNCK